MIERGHELSRAGVYYRPVPISATDLQLMRRIDELHLELPFAGSRMLRDLLNQEGHRVGRKHVRTLMRRMGIEAIYRKKNTSRPHPEHAVFPYLLRGLAIDRPNRSLGLRYHVHPDGARLRVPGRGDRLVHAQSPRLAALQHSHG